MSLSSDIVPRHYRDDIATTGVILALVAGFMVFSACCVSLPHW
ncbi:hypothetical protein [Candidatus Ichthyocystis sparus]|nr:hypothetical protein [Candidatus Ichthyocystis sparus]